jgi:RNase P/RNase MRP subunit POP5
MAIKKSLRKGGRYILFKQHYKNKPLRENEIVQELKKYMGLVEIPPIKIIHFDEEYGLIKTNNLGLKKALISLISYSNKENRIEVIDSSGTIKSITERHPEIEKRIKRN